MKTWSESIGWYKAFENRRWKQVYHCFELALIGIGGVIIIAVLQFNGDGSHLQHVLSLFILLSSLASASLAPVMFYPVFRRWHIFALTLGLGCGMGVSALAAILTLQLQLVDKFWGT